MHDRTQDRTDGGKDVCLLIHDIIDAVREGFKTVGYKRYMAPRIYATKGCRQRWKIALLFFV